MDEVEYKVFRSEPYLKYDAIGKPVILVDETMNKIKHGFEFTVYFTEVIIEANPSEAEIFKYKLKQGI